ncbi:PIN domain-containing protein [Phormidesmis sp. 146-35]
MVDLRFLLDTNTISELFRLQPNSSIATKYAQNIDDIAIASVTWHELLYGFHRLPTSRKKKNWAFSCVKSSAPTFQSWTIVRLKQSGLQLSGQG